MADPTNTPVPPGTPVATTPRSTSPAADPAHSHSRAIPATAKPRVLHIGDPVKYNVETYASFSAQCDVVRPSTPERSRPEFVAALRERRWRDFDAAFRPFWGTGGEMGRWDAELIGALPERVRVFASTIYCNSGPAAAEAAANFAIAMIISTFRHIPWCITAAAAGPTFQDCHARATSSSHNLRGHVVGIIGLGNIAQQVAARCAHGFAMAVHYHDVVRKAAAVEAGLGAAVFHETLEGLVRASDCVVLCTPSGAGRVVTAETLAWFRQGARFVNVARGSLADEEALADALEGGALGAVALDVHAEKPAVSPRLLKFAGGRAMLTCHNAGGTVEMHIGFEELSMRNIMAVLAGGEAITPVNMQHLRK